MASSVSTEDEGRIQILWVNKEWGSREKEGSRQHRILEVHRECLGLDKLPRSCKGSAKTCDYCMLA